MFQQITTHVEDAKKRRLTQYFKSPFLISLIESLVMPVQDIENSLTDMNVLRYIDQAQGKQLDNLGAIVGLPRPSGMDDPTYRNRILGQIKINTSQGQAEQLIQLYGLLTGAQLIILYESLLAAVLIESDYQIPDQATANSLIDIMSQARAAGVNIDGLVSFDPSEAFAYDGPLPGLGYDDGSQTVGGKYAELWTRS